MHTSRDYFESDIQGDACQASDFVLRLVPDSPGIEVAARIHLNMAANARFVSFYVAPVPTPVLLAVMREQLGGLVDRMLAKPVSVVGAEKHRETIGSDDLTFTGRVFVYAENDLTPDEVADVAQLLRQRNLFVLYRGPRYASECEAWRRPVAFISYDSSDRETVAMPLATQLNHIYCRTWFDGYSMRAGDDIEHSIAKGLTECERCILILSERYIANQRWARREFDAIVARELHEGRSLMIPIRHGLSERQVATFSQTLARRHSIEWDPARVREIAQDLSIVLLSVGRDHERAFRRGPMSSAGYAGYRLGLALGRVFRWFRTFGTARR